MTSFTLDQFLLPHIYNLAPYATARHEFEGQAEIFLDANENPLGSASDKLLNRYPDPLQAAVKDQLAGLKGVSPEHIFLGGGGSDEAIDLLFKISCLPGRDNVVILPPTYGMYSVSARTYNVEIREAPLLPGLFQPDVQAIQRQVDAQTKLIFICSPNNPTGNSFDRSLVEAIINLEGYRGLVVIDEAYIDFAEQQGFLPVLAQYPDVLVLQTFSKAWGMAGLRLGMAYGSKELIAVLNKVKLPYNVSTATQDIALEALRNQQRVANYVSIILRNRTDLINALQSIKGINKVYPSDSNQVLIRVDDPSGVYHGLIKKGIVVRDRSNVVLCAGCLRITVGTVAENNQLLEQLRTLL